ncbi:MAG: hypothetical protein L0211_22375 [Planctomycetaceae bacterium]|nr:hypothetical protein [Planctomycetaceae bacterium]
MRNLERMWWPCLAIVVLVLPAAAWGADASGVTAEGKQLFQHEFTPGKTAEGGDGLGPVFNHHSCAACHSLAGTGGAGPVDVNAVTLTADLTDRNRMPTRKGLATVLREIHGGFVGERETITPSILLHRFSTDSEYAGLQRELGGPDIPLEPTPQDRNRIQRELARQPKTQVKWPKLITLELTQRNTTALFGAGAIDQIPAAALEALAATQAKKGEVSGRVPPIGLAKVGRFGWRGQTERLHDFVIGACSNELGLEVPGSPQPTDPMRPRYRPGGYDLTAAQCASLTAYVASLPQPKFELPKQAERRALVLQGRSLFDVVGCAACHVERIGPVEGLYSDLLLHDMGTALADPIPAEATFEYHADAPLPKGAAEKVAMTRSENLPLRPRGYYGESSLANLLGGGTSTMIAVNPKTGIRSEFRVVATSVEQEWRTPPLWGVADSAPYLHDGRADSLVDAIALHGGEADASMKKFFELPITERMAVLEFLCCLRAP